MVGGPVSEDELRLAKDYLIGSFPLRLDTTAKVADFIVAVEEQGLGLDYADRYKASVARVTAATCSGSRSLHGAGHLQPRGGRRQAVIRVLLLLVCVMAPLPAAAVVLQLADGDRREALRMGERSITNDTFDYEWRVVGGTGESLTVMSPFHRLALAARHAAFKNDTLKPTDIERVSSRTPTACRVGQPPCGSEEFARFYVPRLLAGDREIKAVFVQNERTAIRQDDGHFLARASTAFRSRTSRAVIGWRWWSPTPMAVTSPASRSTSPACGSRPVPAHGWLGLGVIVVAETLLFAGHPVVATGSPDRLDRLRAGR